MKKVRYVSLLAVSAMVLTFSACTKDAQIPDANNVSAAMASLSITDYWAQGAVTVLNGTAYAAQTNTVGVTNEPSSQGNRVVFRDWNTLVIGRTNGAGNNGTATHAFGFRAFFNNNGWDAVVPFAFGMRNGRDALWTPQFFTQGINGAYMGVFIQDNQTGDEDATVGYIKVGDLRVIDGDFLPANPDRTNKVVFQKRNATTGNWDQIGRTNGAGDDGDLLGFTVIDVRTKYTVAGGKVTAQTIEKVPVAQILRPGGKKRLSTYIPQWNNIGTLTMLEY